MDWSRLTSLLPEISAVDFAQRAFGMAVVLLLGVVAQQALLMVASSIKKRLAEQGSGTKGERLRRANSLATVLTASLSVLIWAVVALSLLQQLGVDIGPFLASAGIVGLALSFGSQELVKDVISGLFFLLENQFNTGDKIKVADKEGVVTSMSLRTVTLKDAENSAIYIIRNSQVVILTRYAPAPVEEPGKKHEKA